VNNDYESSIASSLTANVLDENSRRPRENEIKVPLLTSANVLDENNIRSAEAILKMDCEGCEYDIISASDDVLRRFSHIYLEYHYGYENLKERLEKCGFNVSVTRRPMLHFNPENNKKMYIGDILATLRTS